MKLRRCSEKLPSIGSTEFFRNLARLNFWEKELAKKGPRVELVPP